MQAAAYTLVSEPQVGNPWLETLTTELAHSSHCTLNYGIKG